MPQVIPHIPRAHPLVRLVYREANKQRISLRALSERAGLTPNTVSQWGRRASPQLLNVEAVLNALGYELRAVEVER